MSGMELMQCQLNYWHICFLRNDLKAQVCSKTRRELLSL